MNDTSSSVVVTHNNNPSLIIVTTTTSLKTLLLLVVLLLLLLLVIVEHLLQSKAIAFLWREAHDAILEITVVVVYSVGTLWPCSNHVAHSAVYSTEAIFDAPSPINVFKD